MSGRIHDSGRQPNIDFESLEAELSIPVRLARIAATPNTIKLTNAPTSIVPHRPSAGSNRKAAANVPKIAPAVLAGFDGSKAPQAPVDIDESAQQAVARGVAALPLAIVDEDTAAEIDAAVGIAPAELGATQLTDAEIDAIDDVPSLAGNTVEGVPVDKFLNDVSDLTGEGEKNPEAA